MTEISFHPPFHHQVDMFILVSRQLLDRLPWNVLQTFLFHSGWIVIWLAERNMIFSSSALHIKIEVSNDIIRVTFSDLTKLFKNLRRHNTAVFTGWVVLLLMSKLTWPHTTKLVKCPFKFPQLYLLALPLSYCLSFALYFFFRKVGKSVNVKFQ